MARKYKKEHRFRTRWWHRKLIYWLQKAPIRKPGYRREPGMVRFDVEPGVKPSGKPTVRIFLGTEPAQYRAERVFIWAIKQVRDPARVYEIYIMKDLVGFDRTGWKTGFTHYRYAIPTLAEGKGRAIFNDVDQIYLSDPAELFDMDMKGAGMMGITERENSVMLIDCEAMIDYWTLEDAQGGNRHRHFRDIVHDNNLWRKLPGEWNARDDEYRAGQSKCFHFTTLQTQPWQPLKGRLNYRPHPDGEVWFALERAADKAHFTSFTKENPSKRFLDILDQHALMHEEGEKDVGRSAEETFDGHSLKMYDDQIADLIKVTGAKTVLDYGSGKATAYQSAPGESSDSRYKTHAAWPGVDVTCYDPGYEPYSAPFQGKFDGVICTDVLEHIPEEDIPWVLNEIFGSANKFVYIAVPCYAARKHLPNGDNAHSTILPPEWWCGQLELMAQSYPGISWELNTIERTKIGKKQSRFSDENALVEAA